MIQNYPFFANLLELRKEQFERNTAHMNLSKEEKDRRWRVFEQQQAAEMAMAMQAMNGQSNFSAFESTWKTDNTSTANAYTFTPSGAVIMTRTSVATPSNAIKLPLVSNGTYNFYVDWGDGQVDLITRWNQPQVTHTYSAIGTYNVKILGSITGWDFNFNGDANKIIRINKWGCLRFVPPTGAVTSGFFCGCNNLDLTQVSDLPYLRNVGSLRNMFKSVWREDSVGVRPAIVNRLGEWDVSMVSDFSGMFSQNQYFNQNIGSWDVSSAQDMSFMFASYISIGGNSQKGIFNNGGSSSISSWDVSKVTNMASMFQFQGSFTQPIGFWDVSNVTDFGRMFGGIGTNSGSTLNVDLTNWNTQSATSLFAMFYNQTSFNQNLGNWNVSKVTNFSYMFATPNVSNASTGIFNNGGVDSLKNWDTSSATNMAGMFSNQRLFNQNIGTWNVSKVTNFSEMFSMAYVTGTVPSGTFNNGGQDTLKFWNTSSATNMSAMFQRQPLFNQNIGTWNVSNVTNMENMLMNYQSVGTFNNGGSNSINNWDVRKVTTMKQLFLNQQSFNQPLGSWQPSALRITDYMFGNFNVGGGFNQNIDTWGAYTGSVQSMQGMFYQNTSYNQPMNSWNTSAVIDMQSVFRDATSFNQNIGAWNVGSVQRMDTMFFRTTAGAGGFNNGGSNTIDNWNMVNVRRVTGMFQNQTSFNQPLGNWNIANIGSGFTWTPPSGGSGNATTFTLATNRTGAFSNFMAGKTFNDYSTTNYNAILIGWASRASQTNIAANFGTIRFTAAASASKTILTGTSPNRAWSIADGGVI